MKKWRAAIGFVLLLLVGMLPANIRQAEAGRIDELPTGTSASEYFTQVNIDNKTIKGGESATFSVRGVTETAQAVFASGTLEFIGIKWNVMKGLVVYTDDDDFSEMFTTNFTVDEYTFTINAVERNCILDGAKVSLTIVVKNPSTGAIETITFTETATLNISHTPSEDWINDEEASSGAIQVSNQTCTACGTVVDTKTEVAPLENPVYVGGQALQNTGESVTGNSGTATLYIAQDGSPVLVLDNYVYTGAGHENTEDNYAGIYYGGSDTLYIFCGPNEDSRAVSQNTITVTAEGVKCSRGIYVPNGTLHIGTTGNETEDTLTVTAGTATKYSDGISANQFKVQDATIDFYTSTDVNSTGQYELTTNCVINATGGNTTGDGASTSAGISCTTLNVSGGTVNATGGTAEGYAWPKSYGINCTGDANFSGGKITANGGKASYEGVDKATPEAKTYGINAATISISGADVTATGGTCGKATSGTNGNYAYSYGCYGDITMTSGSLTATGADLLEEAGHRVKESYGIRGSINVSGGTVIATGGNTINGLCYGIYATGDCIFSDTADVTIKTNDVTTDDNLYGLYLKDPATVTVADSAKVDITVATAGEYETYGIYAYTGNNKYVQTGGTVTVSAAAKGTTAYGVWIQEAEISGGTLEVSNKQTAIIISNLTLNGGQVTGTSTGVEADAVYYSPYGVRITTLTMTSGSITGTGGASTHAHSEGVSIITTATVSGGTITGYGGRGVDNGDSENVMSYGVNIDGTLTLSGGTVKGTAGQAYSTSEGVYIYKAILSSNAQIVGQGGISDKDNSVGVSINDASVSGTVTITGNGGQATGPSVGVYIAKADLNDNAQIEGQGGASDSNNSIGVSFGSSITMGAESEAQVTGNGGSGANSMGIKFDGSTLSLLGGSLTATGGTGTTASYGLYTTNNFLMDGTLLIAKGYTSAVGCNSSKEISSDVIVVSTEIAGTSPSPLQYGGHAISTLAEYKYLKAGTTKEVGAEPGKRDISGATITLASSSLTYDGTEQTMTVTSVKLGSVELLDEVTISDNKATDAGTYTLTVTAKDSSYYTGSVTKTFTVNPLKITPDVTLTGVPYAYKSTVDPSAVVVKHGEIVLKLDVDYTVEIHTTTVGENGGIAYVYPINSGSNYTFDRKDANFTVVKAENPVEVTTPLTVIRGGNWVDLTYSNNQAVTTPSYSIVGDALGCTITNGTLTSGDTAGTVTVQATFPASNQYNEAVRTITVTITDKNRAKLDWVTLTDTVYKYNDETKLNTVTHASPGSRAKEDIIEYSGTTRSGATYERSTTAPTQAGNYTVHVTYETRDTIYTGSDDFVIRPKDISSLITVTLGDALTYNGTEQTQTVTEVYDANAGYTFNETEYDITGNKQTDASIYYSLDITGKGNFTGTKTVSYTIAKATPTLGDFVIPSYDSEVDYTGEEIPVALPTSTKIGMGGTYIETYVRDAGTYNITFNVYEGTNYTAAEGLVYGTLTVNQVDRPTTTTNAEVILGGNAINLDGFVSTEGSPAKTYEIVGENHGCSISNSSFTSGSEVCSVTVRVTLEGNKNYKNTVKTFTVTVRAKNTALLTVTQDDVEYNYGEDIGNLSPDFDGEAGTLVSQSMVYAGTLWNGSSYASSETKPTQAGTYTVTVTYESKDTIYTGSTTFNINPKKIDGTITLGPALTYTGAPQTQTIANIQTGDYIYTEEDYDVSGNVQTNAGTYTLTLEGKGNFTGTTSTSYTIAKATPQLSDFDIPGLTAVDYTGEYITVAAPTTTKIGMGEVYLIGANDIMNAGNYVITFGVPDGQNYKAASGFAYGTLTVNKVAHPMTVTNAIVGIGGKDINLNTRVTLESGYYASFEFVTPEAERHGCQINGATFFSGDEPGTVTVRATVQEGTNYRVTSKEFTVTVVEEGGVKVYCSATCSCSNTDETTFQLLHDGVVKYEIAKLNNNPSVEFDGVAAGTYTLRVSKANHITVEKEVAVASEDVTVEPVELKLYKFGQTAQIRLIEPWGLKANVRVHDGVLKNIDYTELYDYGVYFIRKSDLDVEGATQSTLTIDDIVGDSDATHMSKGNGVTVEHVTNGSGDVLTATYDEKLYTYEFSDSVFVMFYIVPFEGASPIYVPIRERNLSELISTRKDDSTNFPDKERDVYTSMNKLEADVLDYRADFGNPSAPPEQNAPTLSESPLSGTIANTGTYKFGHTVQIRLIEPWGMKVNARVYTSGMSQNENIDYEELIDYGVVILMDNNTSITTAEELLARSDAYIFSKTNGEAQIQTNDETEIITATFTKGVYTYLLNSKVYVMFFVKDAEGYHFGAVKERNVYELMKTRRNDTSGLFTEKEKILYDDMVNLYDTVTTYRADYIY